MFREQEVSVTRREVTDDLVERRLTGKISRIEEGRERRIAKGGYITDGVTVCGGLVGRWVC